MNNLLKKDPYHIALALILILAAILRFWDITTQSAWVDELHTMNEADPDMHWKTMLEFLKCCDQHPPLYYFVCRFLFITIDHSVGVARSVSAICGIVSVWGMYLLGKEFLGKDQPGKELGIIAALLTSINYYGIYYSHEARCYSMAFVFTIFSYIYFIRFLKNLKTKDAVLYAVFTIFLLYSHYYSLFIVAAQALIAAFILVFEWKNRKNFIKPFLIGGGLIAVGYLPWVPFLLKMSSIKSFWIAPIQPGFATEFFYEYFGNFPMLNPILVMLLIYYCFRVFRQPLTKLEEVKTTPLQLSFLIFFLSITVTYMLPYLRSILVVPMLFTRYTIVVIPFFIMAIAFALIMINSRLAQFFIITTIVVLSLLDMVLVKRFFKSPPPRKTQFEEVTQYISEGKENFTIIEDKTAWHHAYYLKRYKYTGPIIGGNKEAAVDSILLRSSAKYDLNEFWIVGAHGAEPHLRQEVQKNLDTAYVLVRSKEFFDAWAELYARKSQKR